LEKYGTMNFSEKTKRTIEERYGSFSKLLMCKAYDKLKNKYENIVEFLFDKEIYSGAQKYKHYSFKCKKCLTIFDDYMTNGFYPKCPTCNPHVISYQEKEILNFIKSIFDGEILENTRKILPSGKELDIYIPSKKLAIEYNGIYWHSELVGKKDRLYHVNKTDECEKLGIHLIHIFEDEWIDSRGIIESKLKYILDLNINKIYARNCIVKPVNYDECSDFLDKYHIQGNDKSFIRLGLYHKDDLVSIMTFGKNRISLGNKSKDDEYEMYRFCSSMTVVGSGSKLLSHFIKNHSPLKIISYADRRWSNNSVFYSKVGFDFIKNTVPSYWYFNKIGRRFHRFNFRKDQLSKKLQTFDPSLTEWENMQLNGYDRIWDCGNLKYEWINPKHP